MQRALGRNDVCVFADWQDCVARMWEWGRVLAENEVEK